MSIAIVIGVHDGVVIASDSASTLMVSLAPNALTGVANVYDNANKIFNLYKGKPIGCVAYGQGGIGNSSIGTLIKDLRRILMNEDGTQDLGDLTSRHLKFDPEQYTMEGVSDILAAFLEDECQKQPVATHGSLNIGVLLGGYSTGQSLGETWHVEIRAGKALPLRLMRKPEEPAISWGGSSEVVQRIILGYSPSLFAVLASVSGGQGQPPVTPEELSKQLSPILGARLQAPLVFAPMPIQDAIDLAEFLVHAAIMYSRFLPGAQIVGGRIEIAAITKHEGFKWIKRKHYYDSSLNRESQHVVIDRQRED
jgi:hypothetical protein